MIVREIPPETSPDAALAMKRAALRVLTWNVQHASAARGLRQAAWLAAQPDADVIALTEVAGGASGDSLAQSLAAHGYRVHLPVSGGRDYRVLLATRVGELQVMPLNVTHLPHRAAGAVISHPAGWRLGLVGLYVPSRGPRARRNLDKRAFQDATSALLSRLPTVFSDDLPVVVAGDLNVVEPGHQPHHSVFGKWEYDFYRSFATAGYTDLYRMHHPERAEHSWFGRSGAGYRFDHLFCTTDQPLTASGCRYIHHARSDGLSDHSALSADLIWVAPTT
ncbi:endonuclease/exonuclease/phosphatase family protein [Micromonospora sp. HUAS LYJ1]|uniref:endonuclease/exonuclease/phosphatase family protein n=1 Tax=Micromonospora sp. HUAS LYJ1 TaxID=3061626 RepID=UPI00267129C9|nr:endonuclease/exonuclease/phosphatase family protein [Micromonospora sp. HUAS LYJ1]WKU03467.1 endonuclease/exonuclease/phosphatase family protein [Micromonospora sp. HUAS LYJ1]